LLEIVFGHHILSMYLRHLFTKVCILRWISFVTHFNYCFFIMFKTQTHMTFQNDEYMYYFRPWLLNP